MVLTELILFAKDSRKYLAEFNNVTVFLVFNISINLLFKYFSLSNVFLSNLYVLSEQLLFKLDDRPCVKISINL